MTWTLHHGDCLAVMPTLPENNIDNGGNMFGIKMVTTKGMHDLKRAAYAQAVADIIDLAGLHP